MSVFSWCSRRVGGLSILALVALSYWVIQQELKLQRASHRHDNLGSTGDGSTQPHPDHETAWGGGVWTYIFVYYCVLVHVAVFMFPIRSCWSVWDLTNSISRNSHRGSPTETETKACLPRRGSYTSVSSSDTLVPGKDTPSTAASSEAGDLEHIMYQDSDETLGSKSVIHAIVVPNYKEELDTLRETLEVLASHSMASVSYDVYLGMEEREHNGKSKALGLIEEFSKKFRSIDYTMHPGDIPGEAAGKGSNMAWAARHLSAKYPLKVRKNVVVTGIDADSHLASTYFAHLTDMHLSYPETASTTLYAAPIIFDRNAHNVPSVVRVADILWSAAGMSGLYHGSSIAPPTSVYSLSLDLADRVGGWDADAEAIGEDLHMYIKCFFALHGHLTCRTILSPVSQTNVTGGGNGGIRGVVQDMRARYKQAIRHMWGSLDSGYALRKSAEMWHNRKQTVRAYRPLHRTRGDGSELPYPSNRLYFDEPSQGPLEHGVFSDVIQSTLPEPHLENMFYLTHRLYEAHMLPVHMTILIIASTIFMWVTEGKEDTENLRWLLSLCGPIRALGFVGVFCYIFLYERFHRLCVLSREREMKAADLSDGMCFSHRSPRHNWMDYLMVPLVAPLYGSIPCVQAELSHFWTIELVYTVSKKVTRQRDLSSLAMPGNLA